MYDVLTVSMTSNCSLSATLKSGATPSGPYTQAAVPHRLAKRPPERWHRNSAHAPPTPRRPRPFPPAQALPLLSSLLDLRRSPPPPVTAARAELLAQLSSSQPDMQRIDQLVDTLIDPQWQLKFDEQLLAGGPSRPVYTRGLQLWKLWTGPTGRLLRSGNKASQDFIPGSRQVINAGQVLGDAVRVTAQGSYQPVDDDGQPSSSAAGGGSKGRVTLPLLVQAEVEEGALLVQGRRIPLPIRGAGLVYLAYLDCDLRIFRSPGGSISVQVREAVLPQLLGSAWA